jgi:hypothetical protein
MADVLLVMPSSWTEQLHAVRVDEVALSYNPHTLILPSGRSLSDVRGDLLAGAWLSRQRSARGDEIFRLGGAEFELRLKRRRDQGDRIWMAVLLNVDDATSVPRRLRIVPKEVNFSEVWNEARCDLVELEAALLERERQLSERRRRGPLRQAEVQQHGRLQAEVLREYGELETLVGVLEQRPERPEETVEGVVRPDEFRSGARPAVLVEPVDGDAEVFRGKRIRLTRGNGRAHNTQVLSVRRGRIQVALPRDCVFGADEPVSLSVVRPFGMRQNAEALARFRAGDIEGSWDDLARLLCRPADLLRPPLPLLSAFYCDSDPDVPSLNAEQRRAVTGAVGSPHTFLIQGPPGTGKTEVIGEVVRQLIGRGERVLLLAPTHVAVDEVLRRIGRKPGVRPLRITWSDDLVDEQLHGYLPKNVGVELARQILRPTEHGQVDQWQRELAAVRERLMQIELLRGVVLRRTHALADVRAAEQLVTEAGERLEDARFGTEQEVDGLRRALARDERELADAEAGARDAVVRLHNEIAELGPTLRLLRDAARDLAAAGGAAEQAAAEVRASEAAWNDWRARYQSALDRVAADRVAAERAVQYTEAQLTAVHHDLGTARAALDQAQRHQRVWGSVADYFGFGAVADARHAVTRAELAVLRWQAEWDRRDDHRRRVAMAQEQVVGAAQPTMDHLRRRGEAARAALDLATGRQTTIVQAFTDMLAALGGHLPDGATDPAGLVELGITLGGMLTAALEQPATLAPDHRPAPGLGPVADLLERLRRASAAQAASERGARSAAVRHEETTARLAQTLRSAEAELALRTAERDDADRALVAAQVELAALTAERDRLVPLTGESPGENPVEVESRLLRRRHVLERLPALDARWRRLAAERTDEQFVDDLKHSLIRASNLVCATTKGIVGKGSDLVRHTDYDTLIVDEASRVTESEFLIGAVRSRRWVLVGDEHQLPPYVDQEDEYFLHALTALHRVDRGVAKTVQQAVDELATLWSEDEKERVYRTDSVRTVAEDLASSGRWAAMFQSRFAEVHHRFKRGKDAAGIDRRILESMRRYLVQSLFQRAVIRCGPELRQPLELQRRMIAPLAEIVNRPIYRGRYRSPSDADLASAGVTPLVLPRLFERPAIFLDTSHYKDAGDTQIRHGFVNKREQEMIVRACTIYNEELRSPVSVSVLAFYRAQARELERRLLGMKLPMLQWEVIDVIDKIQGQQSDLVLLSFTRANPDGVGGNYGQWLQDLRRLNVACTRARRALVLVGHSKTLRRLRTKDEARQFYANLLGLFDTDDNFQRIEHLD